MVGNLVLWQCASGALKHDFRTYIRQYTSPNENFEYCYPHSNALLLSRLKLERCKQHKAYAIQRNDVINDIKLFPTVYCRICCRKFVTLSNQTSRYKSKCIKMKDSWFEPYWRHFIVSLCKTLYPLLSTGSMSETSPLDLKLLTGK